MPRYSKESVQAQREFYAIAATRYYEIENTKKAARTDYCPECKKVRDFSRREEGDWESFTCLSCGYTHSARTR